MTILQAIILGIIQGLTEFLPISSSGHLVLTQQIMGLNLDNMLFFDLILHLGTLVAVITVWYKDIGGLFKKPFRDMKLLILASIPAVIALFILGDLLDEAFSDGKYLCFSFLVTAGILFVSEYIVKRRIRKAEELAQNGGVPMQDKDMDYKSALVMGLAQVVAIVPGVSRSGSTICSGLVYGVEKDKATKFSFLMSIVVIGGGAVLQLYKVIKAGTLQNIGVAPTLVGMFTAGIVGYLSIRLMLTTIKKLNFKYFSLYLAALSIFTFINYFVTPIW